MKRVWAAMRIVAVAVVGVGAMVALMVALAGGWIDKILPGGPAPAAAVEELPETVQIQPVEIPVYREAVGSISAEHETALAPKMLGRVEEVAAAAGAHVAKGDLLVRLDDAEQRAKLVSAEAALKQAADDFERIKRLEASGNATSREVTQYTNALQSAQAACDQAKTILSYARIVAPADGVIVDKYCEVGDVVQPGQTVVRLYDRLQMTATVPESLQGRLAVGQGIVVHVDALGADCLGRVAEIVPQAQAASRAFQVKVTGPCQQGVMIGMFARLKIPMGRRAEIRIPAAAVRRVGQITTVFLVQPAGSGGGKRLVRQFVQLGSAHGDQVEVLSGLADGDRILARADQAPQSED